MIDSSHRDSVLIYRDFLLSFSETFILSQGAALSRYRPVFVGRRRVPGLDLGRHSIEVVNEGGIRGGVHETQYRLGLPPRPFLDRLSAMKPTLMHAPFGPDALNALPLRRRLGLPLVVTFHGYDATQHGRLADGLASWRYVRRRHRLAEEADCILAVSNFIRDRLLAAGFSDDHVQTHRIGVDTAEFTVGAERSRGPVVLGVGRFVEKKGFEFLIDAMGAVQREHPDSELILIGTGPLHDGLRQRAARTLGKHQFLGSCPRSTVAHWMQRARVLAVPSVTAASGDTEGLPTTLVEGLASGLPAVGTRHAGIPEAIIEGETGFLVPERDVHALGSRIGSLLGDNAMWSRFSEASRRLATLSFDLKTQTSRLEEIYEGLGEPVADTPAS